MTATTQDFSAALHALAQDEFQSSLPNITRGVERETLRVNADGSLAQTPHPEPLGSALTHDFITTDFSESLLEFITPPETSAEKTLSQLWDVHKYVTDNIGEESLWPTSMPCFIDDENRIPIANYGESNVGKMKRVYRIGLKNRYGSMMQAIAGVHFNFSLPEQFWRSWATFKQQDYCQDFVSAEYFSLIRNYRRMCWLIPYLYGASPALCQSFLKGKEHALPFEKLGKGTLYMPYATSLRMSDLGYTNSEQSALKICYNELDNYIALLRQAMYTPSQRFSSFAAGEGGHFQQLSKNVLQIENELYSPIRPKQVAASMEKPTDALARRGVSYIEIRALDVNPFSPVGITREQIDFLDVFLLTCLLKPSARLDEAGFKESESNLSTIVLEGRKPNLSLMKGGKAISMAQWASSLFDDFQQVAVLLDSANSTSRYSTAVAHERKKVTNPDLTYSGMWLSKLQEEGDNGSVARKIAVENRKAFDDYQYRYILDSDFKQGATDSLASQLQNESDDDVDFSTFISNYFEQPPAKKKPD